jgi:hypothetical protein
LDASSDTTVTSSSPANPNAHSDDMASGADVVEQFSDATEEIADRPTAELSAFLETHHGEIAYAYSLLVARAGLYGQAFYGHRATPKQRRQLRHLWKEANRSILKMYGKKELEAAAQELEKLS